MWIEKYAPREFNDIILNEDTKNQIKKFLEHKDIPNLFFFGFQGIGKSTLSKMIVKELGATCLYINTSIDNNVDMVRNRIKNFCDSMSSSLKIVLLDEADALSSGGGTGAGAQDALRNVIDENSDDTRFILTGNYEHKIIPPLKSRCLPIHIDISSKDVIRRIGMILKEEGIKYTKNDISYFVENVVKRKLPDIRSIINNLEYCCVDGSLNAGLAKKTEIESLAEDILTFIVDKNWVSEDGKIKLRKMWYQNEDKFNGNYILLAEIIFDNIVNSNFQIIIAEHIWRMGVVANKEIQFTAMIYKILDMLK